jgi:hypothetical protein
MSDNKTKNLECKSPGTRLAIQTKDIGKEETNGETSPPEPRERHSSSANNKNGARNHEVHG